MIKRYVLVSVLFCLGASCAYADMYRYKNAKGELVLSNQVPGDQLHLGYEVLDKNGQLKEVIAADLTPKQRKDRDAKLAQQAYDKELMAQYSSLEDLDTARAREMAQVKNALKIAENNVKNLKNQKENLNQQAANIERGGGKVSTSMLAEIAEIDHSITGEQAVAVEHQRLKLKMMAAAAKDRQRFSQLKNGAASIDLPSEVTPLP